MDERAEAMTEAIPTNRVEHKAVVVAQSVARRFSRKDIARELRCELRNQVIQFLGIAAANQAVTFERAGNECLIAGIAVSVVANRPAACTQYVPDDKAIDYIPIGCRAGLPFQLHTCGVRRGETIHRKSPFGSTKNGEAVELFTLRNNHGLTAKVMTYGGIIYSLEAPDKNGKFENVTANRPTLADYEKKSAAFGALLGRFANRIAGAKFSIDGTEYSVTQNAGKNHIHGGARGFDKRVWTPEPISGDGFAALRLTYLSKDGEEGYPGNLKCVVRYELNDRNEWKTEYEATTDKPTPINLSNHAYWNLGGAYSGTVLDHVLTLNADRYLLADEALIPTGEIRGVEGHSGGFSLTASGGGAHW